MRSVLMTVEHLLIPVGFRKSGSNPQAAMATYGIIHGMALPLVLYPSALLSSLSGLLVPEISSQNIAKNNLRIGYMIARVLHIALIFSVGTAGIMYFTSDELSTAVYNSSDVGFYTRLLSPLIPVMYIDMTIDGMLKGLDQQVSYMKYNIIEYEMDQVV
jgi:stage V sporulation protein B